MARILVSRLRPCANSSRTTIFVQFAGQTRCISQSWLKKVAEGEERWAERAARIQAGEQKHVWDVLEERGYIKDVAGYESHTCFEILFHTIY
jgi:hypothetical protein